MRPRDFDSTPALQPGGPFALIAFHDDAHDNHLGIVYRGLMKDVRDGAWSLDDRFWQDALWSKDVNAMVWSMDGSALYVSTGDHGSGGVFRLELRSRKANRIWPDDDASAAEQGSGRSCEILNTDPVRKFLRVRYQASASRQPIAVEIRME